MGGFLWSAIFFIIALGVLVAVHEWGHFWVARRCGVKVLRFSIGFGKPLWRRTDKQGTEYVVAAIPLGGYVRMLDRRVDDVAPEDMPFEFLGQSVYKRIAIIAAGPVVNFLFAILVLYLMYLIGVSSVKPIVGEVIPDSIAAQAKLRTDEQIVAVGGRPVRDWNEVTLEVVSHVGDKQLSITTAQPWSASESKVVLDIGNWQFDPDTVPPLRSLGIVPFRPAVTTTLGRVAKDSAAAIADLRVGDKIVELDGTPVDDWREIVAYISQRPDTTVGIIVERENKRTPVMVQLKAVERHGETVGQLGVLPLLEPWPESHTYLQQYGPVAAVSVAIEKTWRLMTMSVQMLGKLVTGDVSLKNLSGPIGIAQGAGTSASYGLVYFLGFLALISVNLGVINLLPLPLLDGGHLLYFTVEVFTGKPVPDWIQERGYIVGAMILLSMMSLAIFNDIARL